jgi:aspartate racemase
MMIGVLGGMGPVATVDFFHKVIVESQAKTDEDHVPLLIQSDPRIPPRPAAILQDAESPLTVLMAGRDRLITAGAQALVMPCNTAHFWFDELAKDCPVPFLSIVDACCRELGDKVPQGGQIGVIGTRATLAADLFGAPLAEFGYSTMQPLEEEMVEWVLPGIQLVKAGRTLEGGYLIEQAVGQLLIRGASMVILACTETPLALDSIRSGLRSRCIDSTSALARSGVRWWQQHGSSAATRATQV